LDISRVAARETAFIRAVAGYTCWHHKRNDEIMKELKMQTIIRFIDKYSTNFDG
jgi:hypothetical protein